ncbi:MAG TPA: oligosaccharide flippase family protein [Steroidobacteraceae bacterium]|nr:oligosaccharide flippase family protein [Steroidobacteraceae bacterium]
MKVFRNAFWLTTGRVTGDIASFALFVAISRSFGPATTGEYSFSFALASLLAFLACAGFDECGTSLYARADEAARRRLWSDILTAQYVQLVCAVLCFAIFVALTGGLRARPSVIVELSALLTCQYLARTFFIPAMASQSMKAPALTDFVCRFGAIAFALASIWAGQTSLPALLVGFPAAGVLLVVLAARNAAAHGVSLLPHGNLRRVAQTLRSTSTFTGCELLGQFYSRTDFLLIAFMLGNADVGLYATNMKFVEYGVLPLFLFGIAAYPSLTRAAAFDPAAFRGSVRELARFMLFLAGWLAVGLYCLVPLLITPIFGTAFAPAAAILPWFAGLALLKGCEGTFYRVAYAVRRPSIYLVAMLAGTALTIVLNLALIPRLRLVGAVIAAMASVGVVFLICAAQLRSSLAPAVMTGTLLRLGAALGATGAVFLAVEQLDVAPWVAALAACGAYPIFGLAAGLLTHPSRSVLHTEVHAPHAEMHGPPDTRSA